MREGAMRGAAPVGLVGELEPVEVAAVHALRLWCDGPDGQAQLWNDLAGTLGADAGRRALGALETLCDLFVTHGRRPLMRHQPGCRCLGGDEACFARIIATAATGDREDAMLLTALLIRSEIAPLALEPAERLGLALHRLAVRARMPGRATATLH